MNPLGVPSHVFRGSPAAVAAAIARHGLACVQLTPGLDFHQPGLITADRCRRAAEPFREAGLAVACVAAPLPLLDPDLDRRHAGLVRLHALLCHCRDLGSSRLVAEVGSLNRVSASEDHPANRSAEAWAELRLILTAALRVAADHGVQLLLKAGGPQVLATADDAVRLAEELGHPGLGFVLDPADLLAVGPRDGLADQLEALGDRFGPWPAVVHAKDLDWQHDRACKPCVGRGVLDYGPLLHRLGRRQPDAPVILVHLRPDDVGAAVAHLRAQLAAHAAGRPPFPSNIVR